MASLNAISGKLVFKLNDGLTDEGKRIWRNLTVGGINAQSSPNNMAAAALAIGGLLEKELEQVTLIRSDILNLD